MKFPRTGFLFSTLVALTATTSGFSQAHTRTSFTKDELIANSFSWLANDENRDDLHVYKLSCPGCIEELKSAFENDPKNIGLVNFSTYKKEDRPLAQILVAATLSHDDEMKRSEVFGELLNTYVHSADQFQRKPKEWLSICINFWNQDGYAIDNPTLWADALNWMDRQNRINQLMDMNQFPGSLELKEVNQIPPITRETFRDQYAFVALSLPWLKYPEVHPIPEIPQAQNHPQQLPVVILNPIQQFSNAEWEAQAHTAKTGAFWNFVGDPDITLHPRLLEFIAAMLELPTDLERQEAFSKAIEQIANSKSAGAKSFLATLPRVKDLPKVSAERKEQLIEEARRMMSDFLIYDRLRNSP
ncbi:MAG: hypothetical protein O3C43_05470 [Verrucomicrobia bacterium]|nr:hypothetical protein [Verrucomicrobiota bacterium]MDA1065933.1 hypothetical protein [Verrucomicrobiota bacterium]